MTRKKSLWCEDAGNLEMGRELTESELDQICGGTGGSNRLPSLSGLFDGKDKSSSSALGKNNALGSFSGLDGLDMLAKVTGGLLGTLIQ
jgi:hypothetical protein